MRTDLLIRTKATKKQSSLVRTERVTNVQSAFKCTEKCDGKKILLFDDIYTTGNTAQSCARELANNGAEQICALTLACYIHKAGKPGVRGYEKAMELMGTDSEHTLFVGHHPAFPKAYPDNGDYPGQRVVVQAVHPGHYHDSRRAGHSHEPDQPEYIRNRFQRPEIR